MNDLINNDNIRQHYNNELFFGRTYQSRYYEFNQNGAVFDSCTHKIGARFSVYTQYDGDRVVGIWVTLNIDIYCRNSSNDLKSIGAESYTIEVSDPNGVDFLFDRISLLLLKYKMGVTTMNSQDNYYHVNYNSANYNSASTSTGTYAGIYA
jgi:hypothetical protein